MNTTQTTCNRPIRDKAARYQIVSNTLVIIAALFIVQRFAFKFYTRLELGLDDWCTLLTLVAGIPSTVINAHFLTVNGIGRDIWTLTPEQITNFSLYFYLDEIIYLAEVSLAKLALLFFYMRIFPSRNVQRLLWGTIAFDIVFGLAFVLVAVFQCSPVNYFWVMWDGEHKGQCLNINAITWSNAIISISMDVWMLAIPLWQLRTLRLGWKKKAGVAAMFSVGAFVTVVSILRLTSLIAFSYSTENPTWDFFNVGIWSDIEINVSMICVCLPSIRLLLVRLFPRLRETTQQYYADRRTGDKTHNMRKSRRGGGDSQNGRDGNAAGEDGNGIWYQKSFTVKYVETDELQLVSMRDRDRASAKSESSLS
ncbi:integral membrane protein, putative [Metarhizium acridum CQMa 102]|uniref:Integral membrane protein, putative n=1 Tax=Metarhizium acridum (strain CQMa 102) TaxID=655827 RepID=E9E783_METAQ|nr:integral membrane protein, putative [Metarhizium acridum CQMa 102]EFY88258.1 integral membrane protein, putative [Metarhizium acridum CQMa 102]